ncbi:MAG: PEGA domain-containing protein [Candidatus Methanomethylicaceae archaeon]
MSITAQLAPIPPVTLIVSTLPGSKVYLDTRPVGTTDANGQVVIPNVQQGSHQVRVSREGYEDWVQTITLNSDLTLPITLTRLPYQRRLQIARSEITAGRTNQALDLLRELASEEPARPEAYELMGQIYYERGDFPHARQMMRRAIQNGGQVKFSVTHDHMGVVDLEKRQWKVYCTGDLIITSSSVQFESSDSGDSFAASRADIREAKVNIMVGSQIGAFHIKIKTRGGERNFNFAPRTKSRNESQMILSLLQD